MRVSTTSSSPGWNPNGPVRVHGSDPCWAFAARNAAGMSYAVWLPANRKYGCTTTRSQPAATSSAYPCAIVGRAISKNAGWTVCHRPRSASASATASSVMLASSRREPWPMTSRPERVLSTRSESQPVRQPANGAPDDMCRARPVHDQRYGGRRRGRGPEPRAGQVREDPARVRHLHPGQRRLHPQLRRALPGRRSHLQLDSRVRRQPGDQQTDGQETADALEPPRRPPAPAASHPGPQRLTRRRLPPVAPRIYSRARPTDAGRVASPNLSRSPGTAGARRRSRRTRTSGPDRAGGRDVGPAVECASIPTAIRTPTRDVSAVEEHGPGDGQWRELPTGRTPARRSHGVATLRWSWAVSVTRIGAGS